MISIILPVLNEIRHGYLARVLECIAAQNHPYELIIVDGGSDDKTVDVAKPYGTILQAGRSNRAERMNIGARYASGDVLLFHHPVTLLPIDALEVIEEAVQDQGVVGGGFRHSFDQEGRLLSLASWWSNNIRARQGLYYLDHCFFVRRSIYDKVGGFPNIPIFEDTVFPERVRKEGKLVTLSSTVVTSARRFRQRGVLKQLMVNKVMRAGFRLGVSPHRLNRLYEGKNPFNVPSDSYR